MAKNKRQFSFNTIYLVIFVLLVTSCAPLKKTEEARDLMNTSFTITVYDSDIPKSEKAIEMAFKEIERIESLLSHTKNTSEVYRLNRDGTIEGYSEDLYVNMQKALYYSEISEGAFDITVQPILDLFTKTFSELKRPPTEDEIKKALELVNYKNIEFSRQKIKFKKADMKITLGGIAKGYAVEKAAEILEKNGIKHALVNAKSSIKAIGNKGNEDWIIALQNPRNPKEYVTVINLNNKSISTSGDYERYFDENKTFHHIIDPKTGYSADDLISVTIITDNAFDADALSTSVFVLGKEKGLDLIKRLGNAEGLIITRDKEIIKSSGFKSR